MKNLKEEILLKLLLMVLLPKILRPCEAASFESCKNFFARTTQLKFSGACVEHNEVFRSTIPIKNNINGIWDNCLFFGAEGKRIAPRDEFTNNFDMLRILDDSTDATKEPASSYIHNANFHVAFHPPLEGFTVPQRDTNKQRPPDVGAPNPYFVEASGISIKGELLHNWLHFRVFMNRSVADSNRENLHTTAEKLHYATGKISAMLMMIKDQEGYPIGDFTQELPCTKTCYKYPPPVVYGDHRNAIPCSYTPPRAESHPGMFIFDVDPGYYDKPPVGDVPDTKNSDRKYRSREGVREVHATWKFNQNTCNYVSEIHIYTLIFEELFEKDSKICPTVGATDCKYYGWSAQYNILYPKGKASVGASDYVNINYWKHRDQITNEIDCHVPLFDAPEIVDSTFTKGEVPYNTLDGGGTLITAVKVPTKYSFQYKLHTLGKNPEPVATNKGSFHEDVEYNGWWGEIGEGNNPYCRNFELLNKDPVAVANLQSIVKRNAKTGTLTVSEFVKANEGVQCPCPAVASPEPLETRTADPARLHGRLIHASHMALAYMFLTPLACFVARYYKETFITVFCFQEYWWYMWHVVLLITSCGFVMGAILSLYRGGIEAIAESDNLIFHKILGYFSIVVFQLEIFTGFFRWADPIKRMKQIRFHFYIGNLNIACAVGSMFAMAFVKESGMTCKVMYTIGAWFFFVVLWYALMESHMKAADKQLDLNPPRSYLPPPVVRLFNRDAPGRDYRMVMLVVYIVNLGIIQYFVSYYIWHSEAPGEDGEKEESCAIEWFKWYRGPTTIALDDFLVDDKQYDDPEVEEA